MSEAARIKVLIAHAKFMMATALADALAARCHEIEVLKTQPVTATEILDEVVLEQPDVALIDLWLPGMASAELVAAILAASPQTKILHLSSLHGAEHIEASLRSGTAGFLPTGLSFEHVHEAIHRAHSGERPVFKEELEGLMERIGERRQYVESMGDRVKSLTPRELEILKLLSVGLSAQEIADELGIKMRTTRNHIQNILEKTDSRTQTKAVARARDQGLFLRPWSESGKIRAHRATIID